MAASPRARQVMANPPEIAIFVRGVKPLQLLEDGIEAKREN